MSAPTAPPSGAVRPVSLAARLLALMMTLGFSGLGVVAVLTGRYAGRTKGGVDVSFDGPPAIALGVGMALSGLAPLALWMGTARAAGWWASVTLIAGVAMMLVGARA